MKVSPDYKKAAENMLPGVITADGFLGNDTRPLPDIILADEQAMQAVGLSFSEAADRMKKLLAEGRKGLGESITLEHRWVVRVDEARGRLPCPFQDGIFRKVNVEVENLDNKRSLIYSELSIHLLEVHHFLQGKGSPFRLEPEILKKVLNL